MTAPNPTPAALRALVDEGNARPVPDGDLWDEWLTDLARWLKAPPAFTRADFDAAARAVFVEHHRGPPPRLSPERWRAFFADPVWTQFVEVHGWEILHVAEAISRARIAAVSALLDENERLRERLGMASGFKCGGGWAISGDAQIGFAVLRNALFGFDYVQADGTIAKREHRFADGDDAFAALARARGTEKP